MSWEVEVTDEFANWFATSADADQDAVDFTIDLLIVRDKKD